MKKNSLKFKKLQRERILKNKPWLKSTGARTKRGKDVSKMNALKTNHELHLLIKEFNNLMRQQKDISLSLDSTII
jgi:hypothetical protein